MIKELLQYVSTPSKEVHISNWIFKLITRFTVNILFMFTVALCASNIFGHQIECVLNSNKLHRLISLKCWAEGVFIDRSLLNGTIGVDIISYGVGMTTVDSKNIIHQAYYQWIIPLLIIQGFILYIPRGIWKNMEKGLIHKLLNNLNIPFAMGDWKAKRDHLIAYMRCVNKKYHQLYAMKYFFCESLSIASVLCNMFIMHLIINDFYIEYQPAMKALMNLDFHLFRQQSTILFPFEAKCNYNTFGGSGSIINHDTLCFLPQNIVNEKIFAFLYFWYIIILVLGIANLIYMLMMITFPQLRLMDVGRMLERTITKRECKKISSNGDLGYWFTLRIYHKNLSPVLFQDLAKELYEQVDKSKKSKSKSSSEMDNSFESYDDDDADRYN